MVLRSKSGSERNLFDLPEYHVSCDMKKDFFPWGPPLFFGIGLVGRWVGCQPVTKNNTQVKINKTTDGVRKDYLFHFKKYWQWI